MYGTMIDVLLGWPFRAVYRTVWTLADDDVGGGGPYMELFFKLSDHMTRIVPNMAMYLFCGHNWRISALMGSGARNRVNSFPALSVSFLDLATSLCVCGNRFEYTKYVFR